MSVGYVNGTTIAVGVEKRLKKRIAQFEFDTERGERLAKILCPVCFYLDPEAKGRPWPQAVSDLKTREGAWTEGVCVWCGADPDLQVRE